MSGESHGININAVNEWFRQLPNILEDFELLWRKIWQREDNCYGWCKQYRVGKIEVDGDWEVKIASVLKKYWLFVSNL